MSEAQQTRRISKVASELNVGVQTVIDFLTDKRFEDVNRNSKISDDMVKKRENLPKKELKLEKLKKKLDELNKNIQDDNFTNNKSK